MIVMLMCPIGRFPSVGTRVVRTASATSVSPIITRVVLTTTFTGSTRAMKEKKGRRIVGFRVITVRLPWGIIV